MVSGACDPSSRSTLTFRTIQGKQVVSFRSHHQALLPWWEWRQTLDQWPRLLSIDYHTDKHEPFQAYAYWKQRNSDEGKRSAAPAEERLATLRNERLQAVLPATRVSIGAAVDDLRHDEHIRTALQLDILDVAFVISEHDQGRLLSDQQLAIDLEWHEQDHIQQLIRAAEKPLPQPPFTYTLPPSRLVILEDATSDETTYRGWRDQVIDGDFLRGRLNLIGEICRTGGLDPLFDRSFILDIDLDAFNTRQAIAPRDPSVFHHLIRGAHAITIAQEPECVEACQLDGERLTAPWLEERLLAHIEQALS